MLHEIASPPNKTSDQDPEFGWLLVINILITIGSCIFIGIFAIMLVPMMADPRMPLPIMLAANLIIFIPTVAALGALCSIIGFFIPIKIIQLGAKAPYTYSMFALVFFLLVFGFYRLVY